MSGYRVYQDLIKYPRMLSLYLYDPAGRISQTSSLDQNAPDPDRPDSGSRHRVLVWREVPPLFVVLRFVDYIYRPGGVADRRVAVPFMRQAVFHEDPIREGVALRHSLYPL